MRLNMLLDNHTCEKISLFLRGQNLSEVLRPVIDVRSHQKDMTKVKVYVQMGQASKELFPH